MENLYSELHNLYPVQKTLRFELIPIGKTKENLEKDEILKEDIHRSEIYQNVKKYCDEYHKHFIDKTLKNLKLKNLQKYYELYQEKNIDKDEFNNVKSELRKEISESFKSNKEEYKGLFGKEMIQNYLAWLFQNDSEKIKEIKEFDRFTTYFTGYNKNRENMYMAEEKSTSIAYRLIDDNLPTFLLNMKIYKSIISKMPNIIENVYRDLEEYIQTLRLDDMFKLEYFNEVLTQTGIEIYNIVISGKSEANNVKIKGINEYINEYNQTHPDRIPKLKELYKQILSDKIGTSFVFETIENDAELVEQIKKYYIQFKENVVEGKENIVEILRKIDKYDLTKIYINNDISLTNISQEVFSDWSYIQNALINQYDNRYVGTTKKGTEKYYEQRKKDLKNLVSVSIEYLEKCIIEQEKENEGKFIQYLKDYITTNNIVNTVMVAYDKCENILNKEYEINSKELIKDNKAIEIIKEFLDSMKALQEFVKILIPKDKTMDLDEGFYSLIYEKYDILLEIIALYNKVRNYLTQKPYSTEKIKLNFKTPTFLDGWDVNKEESNLGTLLEKNGNYYLGILKPQYKKVFLENDISEEEENCYKKVEYKLLPGPNKMLPKVLFSKSRFEEFGASEELWQKYKQGLYKKGENFNLDFCHELINFYKQAINKHEDWKKFNFKFLDTNEYEDISQFYRDVEYQGYKLGYRYFTNIYVDKLVEEGKLYLFQIYNKDFSKYSKGKPNLHTMYWKAVFSQENQKDVIYKLNGNAEVFYRKASLKLKDTTIHPANQPIKNKNAETITKKTKSIFKYDLVKNKRYTVDKFQFHVPITMNFKSQRISNINCIVNKYLKYNDNIHIIGIDRGERNLIYVSVIDSKGHIVFQESLNEIINEYNGIEYKINYHELLNLKEKEREKARKAWKSIENIKELKEGYMSQVVHKIVQLMQKYNAIIVIEDLNKGFKNSRTKVEKQIYQKFEKMLIDKLNYLVIKDKQEKEDGGILNAYQLTNEFESFQKLGKQTGILFYIPAWCTSKIDPTTGFINLFYIKNESLEKSNKFVSDFEDIRYNEIEDYFEFDIDYSKFSDRYNESKRQWTICSNSTRIRTFRSSNNNQWTNEIVELTKEFKKLFEQYNINLNNIKEEILSKADSKFYNALPEKEEFYGFTNLFKLMVQMRNSITGEMEDYLISPIKNKHGEFFDSRKGYEYLPKDADANGAYNIARKGLMLIRQIRNTEDDKLNKIKYDITNKEWLTFAQDEDNL